MPAADIIDAAEDRADWGIDELPEAHWRAAQAAVRSWCRWHIAPAAERTITLDLDGSGVAILPSLHVGGVSSVLVHGQAVAPSWSENGVLDVPRVAGRRALKVTFTGGYSTIPDDVRGVVLSVAARSAQAPDGLTREQVGPFSEQRTVIGGQAGGVLLTDGDKEILAPYRLASGP